MWQYLHSFGSPKSVFLRLPAWIRWYSSVFAVLMTLGVVGGLWIAPPDYQQGDGFRIIYIHVPSAFMAMGVYSLMAGAAVVALVWRIKLAFMVLQSSLVPGAWFTFLALFTGAVWGRPMWGTWWIWDARLTSVLILLFIYLGLLALRSAMDNQTQRDKACAVLTLVGLVNIPIIHYSVVWWNTLHQGSTFLRFAKPAMDIHMLWPLLLTLGAFASFFMVVLFLRLRCEILQREKHTTWLQEVVTHDA